MAMMIIRYESNGQVFERCSSFFKPGGHNADVLEETLLNELRTILNSPSAFDNNKVIAHSYDRRSMMSGKTNCVQAIIKKHFLVKKKPKKLIKKREKGEGYICWTKFIQMSYVVGIERNVGIRQFNRSSHRTTDDYKW